YHQTDRVQRQQDDQFWDELNRTDWEDFDARQAYSLLKKLEFKIFQYWIFQALPKKWPDVIDVLSQKERVSWYVKQHKKYVSQGHKVIIWIAGQNAGCYALGEVDSDTYPVVEDNKQYSKPD
ncbi:MAG: EVE domain-containing protein, partial [Bacteroidetes bacterium]|nr:EVE domain-containing protein [Bacteroidota bacterium]